MSSDVSGAIIVLKIDGSDNYLIGTENVYRFEDWRTKEKSTVGYVDFSNNRIPKVLNKKLNILAQEISTKFAIDLSSFSTNLCCYPIDAAKEFDASQDNKEIVQRLLVEKYHTIGRVPCHYTLSDKSFEQRIENSRSNGFIKGGKKGTDGAGYEGTARREFKEETFFDIDNAANYPLTDCGIAIISTTKRGITTYTKYTIFAAEIDISNCNGILAAYRLNEGKSEIFNLRVVNLSGSIGNGNAISNDALSKVKAHISAGRPLAQWTAPVPALTAEPALNLPLFPDQAPNNKYYTYQAKYLKYKAKYLALKQNFNF